MINPNFIFLGIIIDILGISSYFFDTIRAKIQPNRVSWALWSIPPLIAFFAEIKQGVGIQSLLPITIGLSSFIIFLASFVNKKAYWKIDKFDLGCGILSLIGLALWYITHVGNLAIFFSILADGLAYIPTLKKSYTHPESESAWPWLATGTYGLITVLTVKVFDFANLGFPTYYFIINALVFVVVQFKIGKRK